MNWLLAHYPNSLAAKRSPSTRLVLALWTCLASSQAWAGATNDLYVNDDGLTYAGYNSPPIDPAKVAEAQTLPECHDPALDINGNWGPTSEGFQMSVRMSATNYVSSEPIVVTSIARNVSDQHIFYPEVLSSPQAGLKISLRRSGVELKEKDHSNEPLPQRLQHLVSGSAGPHYLRPGTQHKEQVWLDDKFDLTAPGTYSITIGRDVPELGGPPKAYKRAVSGIAVFTILPKSTNSVPQPTTH